MRIYLDAAPVIYFVQKVMPFAATVGARISATGAVLVTSDLTRMECLVGPVRAGDTQMVSDFDDFFGQQVSEFVLISRAVFDRATAIRAQNLAIKTPDALHLAAAVESACDAFLTNDQQLLAFTGITVEVI